MSSINTNASAMTALQTLSATNKSLNTTQGRIATGLRVAEASDNAAYWSIATTMRSDNKALSTVQDSLGLGASKVDTAYTGMNKAIDTLNSIKVKLVAATGASPADKAKIQTEVKALQAQLKAYADGASFSGSNMLSVDTSTGHAVAGTADDAKIVSAFNRNAAGTASISTIDVKVNGIKLYDKSALNAGGVLTTNANAGILDQARLKDGTRAVTITAPTLGGAAVDGTDTYSVATMSLVSGATTASDSQIAGMLGVVEGALKDMNTAATNLGAAKSRIELQKSFTSSLMDSIDRGVGQHRRCRHEQGIDPPAGPPGPAAARYPGSVDCQRQLAVDHVAVPRLIEPSQIQSLSRAAPRGAARSFWLNAKNCCPPIAYLLTVIILAIIVWQLLRHGG